MCCLSVACHFHTNGKLQESPVVFVQGGHACFEGCWGRPCNMQHRLSDETAQSWITLVLSRRMIRKAI